MDRVRFGRALGGGAREAARTLLRAADAAAAPNPSRPRNVTTDSPRQASPVSRPPSSRVGATRTSAGNLAQGGRRFGRAVWEPFARQSGVLWLEFTGVFFALFAVSAGVGVWQHRAQLSLAGLGHDRVWLAVLMFVLFSYFSISSFVRAARRGRR